MLEKFKFRRKTKFLRNEINTDIEYTLRKMPQHNSLVEKFFAITCDRAKAVFNAANISIKVNFFILS